MTDAQNDNNPPVNGDNKADTNPDTGGGVDKNSTEYWQQEAEKWKGLSRKHEDSEKKLLKENSDLKSASMSDAEKAIEKARKEGESTTLAKVTDRLVKAELKAVAAEKGVTLPDLDALNLAKFATGDGDPDEEAIDKFVNSLGGSSTRFVPGADLGIGRAGGSSKPRQFTHDDIKGMSHAERVQARIDGHLDDLLGIGKT